MVGRKEHSGVAAMVAAEGRGGCGEGRERK